MDIIQLFLHSILSVMICLVWQGLVWHQGVHSPLSTSHPTNTLHQSKPIHLPVEVCLSGVTVGRPSVTGAGMYKWVSRGHLASFVTVVLSRRCRAGVQCVRTRACSLQSHMHDRHVHWPVNREYWIVPCVRCVVCSDSNAQLERPHGSVPPA